MSNAIAAVRFSDGTVRFAVYHGSSDTLNPALYDTTDEAWDARRNATAWQFAGAIPADAAEPVEIASDYGSGFWWAGLASREFVLSDYCSPYGLEDIGGRMIFPSMKMTDGHPDWWPL